MYKEVGCQSWEQHLPPFSHNHSQGGSQGPEGIRPLAGHTPSKALISYSHLLFFSFLSSEGAKWPVGPHLWFCLCRHSPLSTWGRQAELPTCPGTTSQRDGPTRTTWTNSLPHSPPTPKDSALKKTPQCQQKKHSSALHRTSID